ncbi:LacI family DNA-binding transcriptional regulator [candidate division KSB1 bacterium]|nr:LacI family DNA-binding transcriptional regulator [candidate division KSB1 bacterium]
MTVTIKDVARRAGVAQSTVSLVLNQKENIHEQTRLKILKAIKELNYHPRRSARGLATRKSNNIGFILNTQFFTQTEPFYTKVFLGASFEAIKHGYYVLLASVDDNFDPKKSLPNFLLERHVDGVVLAGRVPDSIITYIRQQDIPIVLVDYRVDHFATHAVLIDNLNGAYEAVSHLINQGHRRIAFVGGSCHHPSIQERYDGYKKAIGVLGSHNELNDKLVDLREEESSPQIGFDSTKKLLSLKPRPTAFFTVNDAVAIGCIKALRQSSLRVPEDVAVIGFDDVEWGLHMDPPLSTVRVFKEELGATAARKIIHIIQNKTTVIEKTIIGTELVIRESCGGMRTKDKYEF